MVGEASLGLAPVIIDQIFEFLAKIVSAGSSLLIVEQYVTRALALSQETYILSHGEIRFHGKSSDLSADEVFQHYLGMGEVVHQ